MYLHSMDDGDDHAEKKINNMWDKLLSWLLSAVFIIKYMKSKRISCYVAQLTVKKLQILIT